MVDTTSRSSSTRASTSSRCGNGNAGSSTSRVASTDAAPRLWRSSRTSHPGRPTSSPWIGQPVGVGVHAEVGEVDAARPDLVAHRPRAGWPRVRAAAARRCDRCAARRGRRGARGTPCRAGAATRPVMPIPGTNTARRSPFCSTTAGSPRKRPSSARMIESGIRRRGSIAADGHPRHVARLRQVVGDREVLRGVLVPDRDLTDRPRVAQLDVGMLGAPCRAGRAASGSRPGAGRRCGR